MAGIATVVYDGDCAFCTRSAAWLARQAGGSLVVVPWQRADLAGWGLTEAQCRAAVQLVGPSGRASGGQAVAGALRHCRAPLAAAGALLSWRPLRPVVEGAYRLVAANRHRLPGGTAACASDGDERRDGRLSGQGPGLPVAPADR